MFNTHQRVQRAGSHPHGLITRATDLRITSVTCQALNEITAFQLLHCTTNYYDVNNSYSSQINVKARNKYFYVRIIVCDLKVEL